MNDPKHLQWAATFERCVDELHKLVSCPGLGTRCLGHAEADLALQQLGREWLVHHGHLTAPVQQGSGSRPDVYVTSQVFAVGGHTALIGDFVRALQVNAGPKPHLVVTNLHGQNTGALSFEILGRTAIFSECVHLLQGSSLVERMEQLFHVLLHLNPARVFYFHHPDDPLACVACQRTISEQHILVHHADAVPSFGLHLPGITLIDLNPAAAAMTRLQGLPPELLPLTCPDPGPRPHGFLRRGKLVTATSGSASKYRTAYHLGYADTAAVILRHTGGWHVHIGPLDAPDMEVIHHALRQQGVAASRFIHVPQTTSVAQCLWEHECDLYLSSFPTDGARTNAEVAASGTPHLRHRPYPIKNQAPYELAIDGGLVWSDWTELKQVLSAMTDEPALQEKSRRIREFYERVHHPQVFKALLCSILDGQGGWDDSRRFENDQQAVRSFLKSLTQATLRNREKHEKKITSLLKQQHKLQLEVSKLKKRLQQRDEASSRSGWPKWLRWKK